MKKQTRKNKNQKMIYKKSWKAFRETGLLWWTNRVLHLFGWAIVVELDDKNKIIDVYPSKVKFRGFSPEAETRGFRKLTKYIQRNADRFYKNGFGKEI